MEHSVHLIGVLLKTSWKWESFQIRMNERNPNPLKTGPISTKRLIYFTCSGERTALAA